MWPNWKEKSQYPKKLDNDGWAWEFLRRNDQYRGKWKDLLEKEKNLISKYGPKENWTKDVHQKKEVWFFHPPIGEQETIREWTRRVLKPDIFFLQASHREGMGLEWGLALMVDPDLPAPDAEASFIRYRPRVWWHAGDISELDFDQDGYPPRYRSAFLEIDLRHRVALQLKSVQRVLEARQRTLVQTGKLPPLPTPRPKVKQYREFLQILDADRVNSKLTKKMTSKEIAKGIFGEPLHWKNVANSLNNKRQEALALVNKGYLERLIY